MAGIFACFASTMCECACCMGISCFSGLFNASLSRATRFGHLCVVVTVFVIAIILGQSYPEEINGYNYYTKVNLLGNCDREYEDSCIYRQLIYRAGFSLFIMFTALALISGISDYVNKSFWIIKFGLAIGLFVSMWWVDNDMFSGWAEFARIVSFFWLLVQGLLLLDFSHDLHDILMVSPAEGEEESSMPYVMYLGFSAAGFGGAIVGLVFLFKDYSGCELGMFFIILTLIMGLVTTGLSLLDTVGRGLLTPCLMFAYSVFMCWYALLSSPEESCNPTADSVNGAQDGAVIIVAVVSMVILMYCVMNGTTILNVFNPEGEGVMMSYTAQSKNRNEMNSIVTGGAVPAQSPSDSSASGAFSPETVENKVPLMPRSGSSYQQGDDNYDDSSRGGFYRREEEKKQDSGTPAERVLYHVIMMLVSCYGAMILTNWGKTNGAPQEGSGSDASTGDESMWLKIVSQWVFLILYLRVLQVAYNNNT